MSGADAAPWTLTPWPETSSKRYSALKSVRPRTPLKRIMKLQDSVLESIAAFTSSRSRLVSSPGPARQLFSRAFFIIFVLLFLEKAFLGIIEGALLDAGRPAGLRPAVPGL